MCISWCYFTSLFGHLDQNGSSTLVIFPLHSYIPLRGGSHRPNGTTPGWDFFTLMMLLRRGAAFTESRRMVSVSWPPPGRMTPLRRPRDALGGMQSGAPSLHSPSPYPSRSDMSTRKEGSIRNTGRGKLINSSDLTRIKFDLAVSECHLKEKRVLVFLKHEPLRSSDTLEETNHPNLVNYEQILIVTEHRAALTSGCGSDLHSP